LAALARDRPVPVPDGLAARLSMKAEFVAPVLRRLGFRLMPSAPLPAGQCGPPCPPVMAIQRRREMPAAAVVVPMAGNPFAALALLKEGYR
jgi:ATP-dependent RNA helicase SUPV3L1/SUV3